MIGINFRRYFLTLKPYGMTVLTVFDIDRTNQVIENEPITLDGTVKKVFMDGNLGASGHSSLDWRGKEGA